MPDVMQKSVVHSVLRGVVLSPHSISRMVFGKLRQIPLIGTNSGPV
jgi:hypothetical protein